mmetsp:Transcript_57407/g.131168  ORF Transcript_57407/g.131168 Transcript_57407/m.131168 type:complete len:219 (+) Transcript_57407:309-965(+)
MKSFGEYWVDLFTGRYQVVWQAMDLVSLTACMPSSSSLRKREKFGSFCGLAPLMFSPESVNLNGLPNCKRGRMIMICILGRELCTVKFFTSLWVSSIVLDFHSPQSFGASRTTMSSSRSSSASPSWAPPVPPPEPGRRLASNSATTAFRRPWIRSHSRLYASSVVHQTIFSPKAFSGSNMRSSSAPPNFSISLCCWCQSDAKPIFLTSSSAPALSTLQ